MVKIDPVELIDFSSARLNRLRAEGIEVFVRHDFAALYALDLPGKVLSPFFNPEFFDLTPANALWIEARREGEIVQVQAIRVQNTSTTTLGALWNSEFYRMFAECRDYKGLIADEGDLLQGRVTYHGDLWIQESLRGNGLGPVFASLGLAFAVIHYSPDWFYGFVEDPITWTGYPFREGFFHAAPIEEGWRRAEGFLKPDE